MDVQAFLPRIQAAGFTLEADGPDIVVRPFSRLSDAQKQFIRAHKPAILAALTGKPAALGSDAVPEAHGTPTAAELLPAPWPADFAPCPGWPIGWAPDPRALRLPGEGWV